MKNIDVANKSVEQCFILKSEEERLLIKLGDRALIITDVDQKDDMECEIGFSEQQLEGKVQGFDEDGINVDGQYIYFKYIKEINIIDM